MKNFKVALLQFDIALAEPDKNYQKVEQQIALAARTHPDVIVLPEMWNTGYALDQLKRLADQNGVRTKAFLQQMAQQYQLNIVGGSVATQKNEHFFNTSYVFDKSGELLSEYDKVHLFGLMEEDQWITAGQMGNSFQFAGISAAGVICYDIRFPEWERKLMANGQQVLFVSAQWPQPRIAQWKILLQARAIENQAFVVAVNRVGTANADYFNGHSLVIDPLGKIMLDAQNAEGIFTAELDFSRLKKVRGEIPVFKDRRVDLY
ncbi:carbon-nitrogen family hydrolase [Liquorilactobacillus satsumensis]|uniref:carbon-nitrogen family hydrolase n=1 Tax=Liquorilactobacillus satsumensis TaxID=259059 RepID=UPI001E3899D3|nr:carbon-nitrogen family hydrolase [Liquorilactobacillus satsumensis]